MRETLALVGFLVGAIALDQGAGRLLHAVHARIDGHVANGDVKTQAVANHPDVQVIVFGDSRIRGGVNPEVVGAAVGGSSMGGLAALYAHFARPEEFGGALSMSPSLHVGRNAIFAWLAAQPTPPLSRVYLDCGVREGRGMLLPLAARVAAQLTARGYDTDRLRFRADPRGTHSEKCWRRRTPSALRFLYR